MCTTTSRSLAADLKAMALRCCGGEEAFPKTQFADIGAIVFYAKVIPWEFPDFSVERYCDRLLALQERTGKGRLH